MEAEDRGQKSEFRSHERRDEAGKLVAGKWGGMDLTAESGKNAEQHTRNQETESWPGPPSPPVIPEAMEGGQNHLIGGSRNLVGEHFQSGGVAGGLGANKRIRSRWSYRDSVFWNWRCSCPRWPGT